MTDRSIPKVQASHNKDEIEIWHGDGPIYLTPSDAKKLAELIFEQYAEVSTRDKPPGPPPFFWEKNDKEAFGQYEACDKEEGEMLCCGSIGGKEFYLKDFYGLRSWLDSVLNYHYRNDCPNLKKLEGK